MVPVGPLEVALVNFRGLFLLTWLGRFGKEKRPSWLSAWPSLFIGDLLMSDLSTVVNTKGMVSSRVVAEKFGKRHKNVLRAVRSIGDEFPSDFYRLNFEPLEKTGEILMSRDGFAVLAMGFTGSESAVWKVRFLDAFNQMERTIRAEIPALRSEIARLKSEKLLLGSPKKEHGNKNRVPALQMEDTLFGTEVVIRRVSRDDSRVSDLSRKEGKMHQLIGVIEGMSREVKRLSEEVAMQRRR
jgi:Rha family phage regulatory protein